MGQYTKGQCIDCGAPTWDHKKALRCRKCRSSGERNPAWKGDDAPAVDRHHINGDPTDNRSENVLGVCRRCHMELDGRMTALKERQSNRAQSAPRRRGASGRFMPGAVVA